MYKILGRWCRNYVYKLRSSYQVLKWYSINFRIKWQFGFEICLAIGYICRAAWCTKNRTEKFRLCSLHKLEVALSCDSQFGTLIQLEFSVNNQEYKIDTYVYHSLIWFVSNQSHQQICRKELLTWNSKLTDTHVNIANVTLHREKLDFCECFESFQFWQSLQSILQWRSLKKYILKHE